MKTNKKDVDTQDNPGKQVKHQEALNLLKIARGHLDAVIRMIEDERYCIDISTQLLAVINILKKANISVLNKHIETCIKDALNSGNVDEKLEELQKIMKFIEKTK